MYICIKENSFTACVSTQDDCCSPENSLRVQRFTGAELIDIASKGLSDIEEAQKIAHELNKLAKASRKATKASLTGLEHRLCTLCASMYYKLNIVYFNLLLDFDKKNADGWLSADID